MSMQGRLAVGEAASMLHCECLTVAEDDDHMVIGLRIPKAAVLRNHGFPNGAVRVCVQLVGS